MKDIEFAVAAIRREAEREIKRDLLADLDFVTFVANEDYEKGYQGCRERLDDWFRNREIMREEI